MNFDELKETLSDFKEEIEKGLTSTEQYTVFKENLEKLRVSAKKNPFFATLSEVIINPLSKELDRAYKRFNEREETSTSYNGFDLINDPKAMGKIQDYLEILEASYANMDADKFSTVLEPLLKVVNDLDNITPETRKEKDFAVDVRHRIAQLKLSASRHHASSAQSTALAFRYHQTPFNITHKEFATQYRTYMEDLAINATAKDVQQLLEAGQILKIIQEDLKKTQAKSDDEQKLLQEVSIQTPLLLKIVDRQISLKSLALSNEDAKKSLKTAHSNSRKDEKIKKKPVAKSPRKSPVKPPVAKPVKKPVKKAVKAVKKAPTKSTVAKTKKAL